MADNGVSIYIAANSPANARELFAAAIEMVDTGEHYQGELVKLPDSVGAAQVYTKLHSQDA